MGAFARRESKPQHLLVYTEGCQIKLKKFESKSVLHSFITKFKKKHVDPERIGDNWIDFVVYDISGQIKIHEDSLEMVD